MDYWHECIAEAFDDAGITATDKQIATVAGWVEGAHENYGMAHGHDAIPNPLESEIRKRDDMIARVEKERDQIAMDFKRNVAMRRNCDVSDVVLEGGGHVSVH